MSNPQLLDYVKSQIAQGANKETIKQNLLSGGGWNASDIDEAFSVLTTGSVPVAPGAVPVAPIKYAGFWIRWVAVVIDGFVVAAGGFFAGFFVGIILVLSHNAGNATTTRIIADVIGLLLSWTYFCLMTYHNKGATLGKMAVGIRVQSANGQKLSAGQVILRETIGKLISGVIIYIGYIMAGFTEKKRALHDMMAKTVVVYKDPTKPHGAGLVIGIVLAVILPVIAIIGILSSIVLVSLNTARQKGSDMQTKSALMEMRVRLESDYDVTTNQYPVGHSCQGGIFASDPSLVSIIAGTKDSSSLSCFSESGGYAISAALSDNSSFCVDSASYVGAGIASDDGTTASCKVDSAPVTPNP